MSQEKKKGKKPSINCGTIRDAGSAQRNNIGTLNWGVASKRTNRNSKRMLLTF